MKKICALICFCIGLQAIAQIPSFNLIRKGSNAIVAPSSTIQLATSAQSLTTITLDIFNKSAVQHTYSVKRYDIRLSTVSSTDQATPNFCFAGGCYPSSTMVSPFSLVLPAQANSDTAGDYMSLDIDLIEATKEGYSVVKYTIYEVNTPADSAMLTVVYNENLATVGIHEQSAAIGKLSIYPNPASGLTSFMLNAGSAQNGLFQLYNSIGQVVQTKAVQLNEGRNSVQVDVSDLPKGVYVVIIKAGETSLTRKLIVE